ncbi:MAG: 50S ribosomal protein L32 [Ilumatobacteraceae bacterium]|nr:50S ribosomal protein L32 [Ilumatobacteraceae bacterium]MDP4702760.1 50S ribosomal protein L32 [Ilumatobacteraceae bacterium]MDP5108506.1 50S ribosomal protein L32 [Ilumatobacteraceae bacterium]
MKMTVPSRSVCPRCGVAKKPHIVCGGCGWYKGRTAVEVA